MPMNWIKSEKTKEIFIISLVTIILLLVIDALAGAFILKHVPISSRSDAIRGLRIKHPTYHHDLASDYNGLARWDRFEYRFCTNHDGMKSKCGNIINDKDYDIAFLGDSFTEGIGLPYEKTFVGLIAENLSDKKIANLAVASYSPTIYYLKLKSFLEKGYNFKEVVVYIDISDIQDEANYAINDGKVIDTIHKVKKDKTFPLLNFGFKGLKSRLKRNSNSDSHKEELNLTDQVYSKTYRRSGWTFDASNIEYGDLGVDGSINKSLEMMNKLYELCKEHNIKLSVGVYPWPGQILYDVEGSRQVKIWSDFCKDKCEAFYNSFPSLFNQVKSSSTKIVIDEYYNHGDMHFNEKGNALVAADFLKVHK